MRRGLKAGLIVLVVGIGAATGWLILVSADFDTHEERTVGLPAERTMQLQARAYDVVAVVPANIDSVPTFGIEVIEVRSGDKVPVTRRNGRLKPTADYSRISHQGTFTPARAGSYLIVTTTPSSKPADARVKLRETRGDDYDLATGGAIVIGLIGAASALLVFVLAGLRPAIRRLRG